tara:strand:- start:68 stop:1120 length:1053 start_codon:yes stop_codon:yes gene_type:complete
MIYDAVEKFNSFHEHVEDEGSIDSFYLTEKEYERLDLEKQVMYCKDLRSSGDYLTAKRYMTELSNKYIDSKNKREKAIAHYLISLYSSDDIEMYQNSSKAFELISTSKKDQLYFLIMNAYILDSSCLGHDKSLSIIDKVKSELSPKYTFWHLVLLIRKNKLNFDKDNGFSPDLYSIEKQIDIRKYTPEQANRMELSFNKLKKEVLLANKRYSEFEKLTRNRIYHKKWQGKSTSSAENDLGRVLRLRGKHKQSIEIHQNLLSMHIANNSKTSSIVVDYVNIAKNYRDMKDFEQCEFNAVKAYEIAKEYNFYRGIVEALELVVYSLKMRNLDFEEYAQILSETKKLGFKAWD